MITTTLACGGPYFDPAGLLLSLVLFIFVKPLAYFAFIQAFRYRVNRPIPMRYSKAFGLALARAGLGLLIIGGGVAMLAAMRSEMAWQLSWLYLYGERVFSWWLVGDRWAGLRARRLVGWVISGTLVNAAFDLAMVTGLAGGFGMQMPHGLPGGPVVPVLMIVIVIAAFIFTLHVVGRRDSLRRKFSTDPICIKCGYDLTGNLSGRCPECGQPILVRALIRAT